MPGGVPHPRMIPGGVCLLVALLAGCAPSKSEVRIGVISMLSGDGAQPKQYVFPAFQAADGDAPTDVAAAAYDAAGLLLAAIRAAASLDPHTIRDSIAGTGAYEGVTGSISCPKGGDPVKSAVIVRIHRGKLEAARVVEPTGANP